MELPLDPRDVDVPRPPAQFLGYDIILNRDWEIRHEDWSGVRSPGRARRRMKQGHRQRVRRWSTARDPVRYEGHGLQPALVLHPMSWPKVFTGLVLEQNFRDRVSRARLKLSEAEAVRKRWGETKTETARILRETGYAQIAISEGEDRVGFLEPGEALPTIRQRMEVLEAHALVRGGMAVVWRGVVIEVVQ